MDKQLELALGSELVWLPEKGWGYFPVDPLAYDEEYFRHYEGLEGTAVCNALNRARVDLVDKYTPGPVLDIGVGAGTFIKTRGASTYGYDINPVGIKWLKERGLYRNPFELGDRAVHAMTFWDSMEHMLDPTVLLSKVRRWAFVSMPIYRGAEHLLRSKHFKKREHYYYFTEEGMIAWMRGHGFACLEANQMEVECGREDVGTFVFERNGPANPS